MDRAGDWGHLEGRPPSASPVLCPVDPVQERDFGEAWASGSVGGQLACHLCVSSRLLEKKWCLILRRLGAYYTSDELNECERSRLAALEPLPASHTAPLRHTPSSSFAPLSFLHRLG